MATAISIPGPLVRADLDHLPDDGRRFELIDGALLVSPLARVRHQRVVARLTVALGNWSEEHGGATFPGVNVDLDERTHLEPDVAWSSDEDERGLGRSRTPELVVEVSSPSTRAFDRGIKRAAYLSSGAVEVWLVDLQHDTVAQYTADADEPTVHGRGATLRTTLLPGLEVDVDHVLGPTRG